jgi:hypothetical protein
METLICSTLSNEKLRSQQGGKNGIFRYNDGLSYYRKKL